MQSGSAIEGLLILLAISTVSRHTKEDQRDRVFPQALKEASRKGVELLALPGGYFRISSASKMQGKASVIASLAKKNKVAVAVGVDVSPKKTSGKGKSIKGGMSVAERIRRQALRSFVICWSSESGTKYWRQRSITGKDQAYAPDEACERIQEIRVTDRRVEILSCGEIFNQRIKDAIV